MKQEEPGAQRSEEYCVAVRLGLCGLLQGKDVNLF
jgi:hypothetical protein